MSTAPEVHIMVTREMIEAHYKSVMNAARILLSQGNTAEAQDLLSEACSRPYPIPAPAAMPEAKAMQAAPTGSDASSLLARARQFVELSAYREYLGVANSYKLRELAGRLLCEIDAVIAIVPKTTGTVTEGTQ